MFLLLSDPKYWVSNMKNLIWLRNHVVVSFSTLYLPTLFLKWFLLRLYKNFHGPYTVLTHRCITPVTA